MTTGRINQVARDEPPPEPHAQHPDACSRTHPDQRAHTRTTARPAFGFCDPRPNHPPSRMRYHTRPDKSLARKPRQTSRRRCAKDNHATHQRTARPPIPHDLTPPRPRARALARAQRRRRAQHTPHTPCDSAQTALTHDPRAAHLATTRTISSPMLTRRGAAKPQQRAIKRAASQLTPRNGWHSGRDHRRPRPGAFTPRRQPVPSRRTCKHTQVPTLREDAQWETAPSSPARASRQPPPARISAPQPRPHGRTTESGKRAETPPLPTCASSHYSDCAETIEERRGHGSRRHERCQSAADRSKRWRSVN